ncbi:hypothetical protein [Streptomyces sp. NBC_01506]|uniref:hypothetical protein n=1 Tax=Streptomyces sp. NBC_01506 TaxID=2903887 RepID=UPI00386BB870
MTTSPADELRTAAATVRALATAASTATDGTPTAHWNTKEQRGGGARLYGDYTTDGRGQRIGWPPLMHGTTRPPHMEPQHAAYAATMGPALGLALADWLDRMADANETVNDYTFGLVATLNLEALAVARQINGGGS